MTFPSSGASPLGRSIDKVLPAPTINVDDLQTCLKAVGAASAESVADQTANYGIGRLLGSVKKTDTLLKVAEGAFMTTKAAGVAFLKEPTCPSFRQTAVATARAVLDQRPWMAISDPAIDNPYADSALGGDAASSVYSVQAGAPGTEQLVEDVCALPGPKAVGSGFISPEPPASIRAHETLPPMAAAPAVVSISAQRATHLTALAKQMLREVQNTPMGILINCSQSSTAADPNEQAQRVAYAMNNVIAITQARNIIGSSLAAKAAELCADASLSGNELFNQKIYTRWFAWAVGGAHGNIIAPSFFEANTTNRAWAPI